MPAPNRNAIGLVCLAIALAAAAVAAALWVAGQQAIPVAAWDRAAAQNGCPWPSTDPITTVITKDPYTWELASVGVTVTFGPNYLFGDQEVLVTFAPLCDGTTSGPLAGASYYFSLTASYLATGALVSFGDDYTIDLQYDPAYLPEVDETTLLYYYYFDAPPPSNGWIAQSSTADPAYNRITCATRQTGLFAIGGYRARLYLPIVIRDGGP